MSVTKMLPVAPGIDLNMILNGACQNLQAQGFEVIPMLMSNENATLTVKKDRDGIKDIVGLGLECRCTLVMNGNTLNVSIDHEWTNKIIAIAIGWFICMVPFITGIVGAVGQNSLPEKISNALLAAAGNAPGPMQGAPTGYQQSPYQQPQYEQPQYDQNSYQQQPYQQQPYQQQPYQQPYQNQPYQQPDASAQDFGADPQNPQV